MKEVQECISSRWTLSARDRPSSSIINFQYIYFYRATAETRHDDNISSFRWALVSCVLCSEKKKTKQKKLGIPNRKALVERTKALQAAAASSATIGGNIPARQRRAQLNWACHPPERLVSLYFLISSTVSSCILGLTLPYCCWIGKTLVFTCLAPRKLS